MSNINYQELKELIELKKQKSIMSNQFNYSRYSELSRQFNESKKGEN